jgi:IS30 family transposase
MKGYSQLTQEQRYQIYVCKKVGWTQKEIALEVGVHASTVSRELRRNTGGRGYRPRQAHAWAIARQQQRARCPRLSAECWSIVEEQLRDQWSPQQIARRLEAECCISVSHESIYQHIYTDKRQGGTLHQSLRCQKKRRKRYGSGRQRRGQIPGRRCISERPAAVEQRQSIGDWEGDTIVGKGHQQAIVSLVERRSRFTLLRKVERATSDAVESAIVAELKPHMAKVRTVTLDNGKEFAKHRGISQALQADVYFAHPYSSWERGTNENTNGLVRQYFPKKSKFNQITTEQLQQVVDKLNHRPRKVLGWRTPHEVFYNLKSIALTT